MINEDKCYLCDGAASVESVKGEGGNRFDVLCNNGCPCYEIAQGAIDYLRKHPRHREEIIAKVKVITKSGNFPVVITEGIPPELLITSRKDEEV